MDPEVTDAVVMASVARQRWFWLLLLKRGPSGDQELVHDARRSPARVTPS